MSSADFYRDRYSALERGEAAAEEPTLAKRVGLALRALGSPGKRILDFGCGAGAAAKRVRDGGHEVSGVDVSESAIRVATTRVEGIKFKFIQDDGSLPFPAQSFDFCFCSEVLEHLLDVNRALRETHRVLRPEGHLLITVPYHGWFKNLVIATFYFERHFAPNSHIRFFTIRSLRASLGEAGYRVVRVRGVGRCWPLWRSMFVVARKSFTVKS